MKTKQLYLILQQISERRSRIDADKDYLQTLKARGIIKHVWDPVLTGFGKRVFRILDKQRNFQVA